MHRSARKTTFEEQFGRYLDGEISYDELHASYTKVVNRKARAILLGLIVLVGLLTCAVYWVRM